MTAMVGDSVRKKLKFGSHSRDDFLGTVRQRADLYFEQNNISRYADQTTHIKNAVIILSGILVYFCLIMQLFSPPGMLALAMLLGVITGGIPMNLCHDCLHGAYSPNPRTNRLLGFFWDVIGPSSYVWKLTHNGAHHTYTNIAGYDPDIEKPILLRLTPSSKLYPFHYWQHVYIWFLYSIVSINWIFFADYRYLTKEWKRISWSEIVIFLIFKVLNFSIFLGIPLVVLTLPSWQIFLGFFAYHMTGGFSVALVFQLAHLVEHVDFPLPDDQGMLENQWGVHEMLTTANFGTANPWFNLLLGGLNFQIEHHLLPHVAHCHYKNLSPIVRETAREFGLPYHESPTLWSAIRSHYRILRKFGREVNPLPHRPS